MRTLLTAFFICAVFLQANSAEKNDASPEGLEKAEEDVKQLVASFKLKTPEELIGLFIPDKSGPKRYGGYQYYYGFLANHAIINELKLRGHKADAALKKHANDNLPLWQAINGPPNYNVGTVCQRLLRGE